MRRRLLLVLLLAAGSPARVPAQPVFSARTEGVRVDVLVTDASRRPLRGLTAADFEIHDNGVLQQVDVVSYGDVPLNVALVFDVSDSVAGARLEQLRAASRALTAALLPADQAALVTFAERVSLRCPLSSAVSCVDTTLDTEGARGQTALVDGVFAAMMVGESDVGRSLLIAFSDGMDTASWLRPARLLEMARRSDAVVYAIASRGARPAFLADLTETTGGGLYEVDRTADLSERFRSILDEFRHRYVVTYTPRGVAREGWHRLQVRVARHGATVKARPGYQGF